MTRILSFSDLIDDVGNCTPETQPAAARTVAEFRDLDRTVQ